jgi:hypothetical protein
MTGPLVIDALEDAGGVGDHGVAAGAAQVVGGQPFEDLVGNAVGGGQGQLKGDRIGDAGAVEVGRRPSGLLGQAAHLVAGPVDQGHTDAQAAQQSDVQEQVAEVVVLDHSPVHGDDEHPVAEARHVAEDLAQIGQAEHGPCPVRWTQYSVLSTQYDGLSTLPLVFCPTIPYPYP